MDSKFSSAIGRGKKKYRAKQMEKVVKAEAERKKAGVLEKKQRRAAARWVQGKLPKLMEKAAAGGNSAFDLSTDWDGDYYIEGVGSVPGHIMAHACNKSGLKTKSRFIKRHSDGDCGTLWNNHHVYSVTW